MASKRFMPYQSFQFNRLLSLLIPLELWLGYLFIMQVGSKPMSFSIFIMTQLFLFAVILLFYGLWINVTDDQIKIRYGIGLISFQFDLAEIKSVKVVRNKWYYGVGIRFIPHGMLYNIYGLDAVELVFFNRSRIVRIGSAEVEVLQYEIEKRLSS